MSLEERVHWIMACVVLPLSIIGMIGCLVVAVWGAFRETRRIERARDMCIELCTDDPMCPVQCERGW